MIEIEAKIKVNSLNKTRDLLKGKNGSFISERVSTERYFDTADQSLLKQGKCLRVRWSAGGNQEKFIMTFKGPLIAGKLKQREEHEIEFHGDAQSLLGGMGYVISVQFSKRRELWKYGNCEVALDEIPHIGYFVEIEGPDEDNVMSVRSELQLQNRPLIVQGYASMVAEYEASKDH